MWISSENKKMHAQACVAVGIHAWGMHGGLATVVLQCSQEWPAEAQGSLTDVQPCPGRSPEWLPQSR